MTFPLHTRRAQNPPPATKVLKQEKAIKDGQLQLTEVKLCDFAEDKSNHNKRTLQLNGHTSIARRVHQAVTSQEMSSRNHCPACSHGEIEDMSDANDSVTAL